MKRGDRVIDNQVFHIWQGNNWQDESKPALWYWQYQGPRNGRTLNLDMGKGATEQDCIADAKAKVADHNQIRNSMKW